MRAASDGIVIQLPAEAKTFRTMRRKGLAAQEDFFAAGAFFGFAVEVLFFSVRVVDFALGVREVDFVEAVFEAPDFAVDFFAVPADLAVDFDALEEALRAAGAAAVLLFARRVAAAFLAAAERADAGRAAEAAPPLRAPFFAGSLFCSAWPEPPFVPPP